MTNKSIILLTLPILSFGLFACSNSQSSKSSASTSFTSSSSAASSSVISSSSEIPTSSVSSSELPSSSSSSEPEPTSLEIKIQPSDVTVKIPEACSFHVEVNNEKLVKSYMWQVYNGKIPDKEGPFGPLISRGDTPKEQWLDLKDCYSGHTDTYVRTSTFNNHQDLKYRCKITDINDNVIYSDEAHISFSNPEYNKPTIRVGGYILEEGQSLDLADTELGTGIITYTSRSQLKLSNVRYHNEMPISDNLETGTDGIMIYDENFSEDNFIIALEGDNVIHNTYWDDLYNCGGIGLNFFFGNGYPAVVNIIGEGKLAITGGTHAIYCPGTLCLQTELILNSIGSHYNSGIYANHVILDGCKLSGKVNGPIIQNKDYTGNNGTIIIRNDSFVDVVVRPIHPSVGGGIAQALVASDEFKIDQSYVNIDMIVSGDDFDSDHPLLGAEILGSDDDYLFVSDSTINLSFKSDAALEGLSTSIYGIMGDVNFVQSNVYINIDSEQSVNATGIAGSIFSSLRSNITINCAAKGTVYGMLNNESAGFGFTNLTITTCSYDGGLSLGFMWTKNSVTTSRFIINAMEGIAYGVLSKTSSTGLYFDPAYVPSHIDGSKLKVLNFTDQAINRYSIYFEATAKYNVIETIYSLSDTEKPASNLIMDFE